MDGAVMPLIPMNQTVVITPVTEYDRYNEPITGTPYTLKCRIQEGTKLVRAMSQASALRGSVSEEVVSTAQIYFDKLVTISQDDIIAFTDELGNVKTYTPISIEIKRGLSGKALLTVVNV